MLTRLCLFFYSFFITTYLHANDSNLKCSQNGTNYIFVPQSSTSTSNQLQVERRLGAFFTTNEYVFDPKDQKLEFVSFPTQGIVTDKINFYMNKLGSTPEKSRAVWREYWKIEKMITIKNIVTHLPVVINKVSSFRKIGTKASSKTVTKSSLKEDFDFATNVDSIANSNATGAHGRIQKAIDIAGSPVGRLNTLSLMAIENEYNLFSVESQNRIIDQVENDSEGAYGKLREKIVKIKSIIYDSINNNKRIFLISHGNGDQLLRLAFAEVREELSANGLQDKDNYLYQNAMLLRTSPTLHFSFVDTQNSKYMRNDFDRSNLWATTNYKMELDDENFILIGRNLFNKVTGSGGGDFLEDYFSDQKRSKYEEDGVVSEYSTMYDHFTNRIGDLSLKYPDNCIRPRLKLSSIDNDFASILDEGIFQVLGYASPTRSLAVKVEDVAVSEDRKIALASGYDNSKTTFEWSISWDYVQREGQGPTSSSGVYHSDVVAKNLSFPIPYRDRSYNIRIRAVNSENGKLTVKSFHPIIDSDKRPQLVLTNVTCVPNSNSNSSAINIANAYYKIVDDDQRYDNRTGYYEGIGGFDFLLDYTVRTTTAPMLCGN